MSTGALEKQTSKSVSKSKQRRPMVFARKERAREVKPSRMVAYDLETTRIAKGTPRPLYLTAYSDEENFILSEPIESIAHLGAILSERFLVPQFLDTRFVAWNGNHFDAYMIAAALLHDPRYVIRPFLTRGKTLRGMLVMLRDSLDDKKARGWYFVDGIAMLGLVGVSLAKFLKTFAPDFEKLSEVIDFDSEDFDADNPAHVEYAERDSIGLWHGMRRAEDILMTYFNESLGVTMGRACIKIFQAHIPECVTIHQPDAETLRVIRDYAMRGGYCHSVRAYVGPVWKYDINQAYAAAMRDAKLPAGRAYRSAGFNRFASVYFVRIKARKRNNPVPFYCKTMIDGRIRAVFENDVIRDTWITSIEYEQLKREGWQIDALESVFFDESFSMREYVNKLERLRTTCEGGPSGAIGTMVKAVGNHSYGKTVEQLDPLELVIASECPPGFAEFFSDEMNDAFFSHVWYRLPNRDDVDEESESLSRVYHQPQIGSFITAHVRMVVRRAALTAPDAWIYADTDCVVFTRDVTASLDVDPKRYGAWKLEASAQPYRFITKKVYTSLDGSTVHAKGLNVRNRKNEALITQADFEQWFNGKPPTQKQIQRNNFLKVMKGDDMFAERTRKGTRV